MSWEKAFNIVRTIKSFIGVTLAAVHIEAMAIKRCVHRTNKAITSTTKMVEASKSRSKRELMEIL